MTILVLSDENNKIVEVAPIARKFTGQHIKNLANWLRRQGEFRFKELT